MKQPLTYLRIVLPLTALLLCGLPSGAITFTNDTAISFNNTNYDGADVVVTNCTLTVDGQHSFASLQVVNGGNLTHTFSANGTLLNRRGITNEQQVLSVTNVATLSNASVVVSSILVQDLSGLVTYTNGADYVTDLDTNGMTTLLLTTNSTIAEGSTNLVSYDVMDPPVAAGLSLTVTGDVFVAQGGTVNVDAKGYDGALGPGAGRSAGSPVSGGGAGHGGYGGQGAGLDAAGLVYGLLAQPTDLGSGGGRGFGGMGGAGGGSVKLVVGGNLRIDGSVSANGANGINNRSGGGSGGSIWLTCQNLAGTGVLAANGGAGEPSEGGGGAGGRISLQFASSTFSGPTPAHGGNGYTRGGAGTVYTRANSRQTGQVLVDNSGKAGMGTSLPGGEIVDLTAQGGAIIAPSDSQTFANLLVASNAWISLSKQQVTVNVTVTGNATIQAGGGITADGAGYPGGAGTGAGKGDSLTGGGGGYGGYGAAGGSYVSLGAGTSSASGGITYGSVATPQDMGSGGGSYYSRGLGGSGGGAVRLNVTGLLLLDGRISAEGSPAITAGSGGGSGGSVWVTAGTLAGAGTISANGGLGNGFGLTGGGGGGGGRIAIQYGTYLFFGATSARGANGSARGGAGTIYTRANNQSYGQLLVDNGGQSGTNTSWGQTATVDLIVKGGAVVTLPSSQTLGSLWLAPNGWLNIANQALLTVTGNATIQAGGGILADGTGNAAGVGPGAGKYVSTSSGYIGGGGGYGGYGAAGGAPPEYLAYGGNTYGTMTSPFEPGSGGGTYSTSAKGGAGGGAIRLNVSGVLQVDGRISAAGGPATTPSAGGGSGGAINITAGTLAGSGLIAANGGAGNYLGGGGGGGRIAIVYGGYNFAGVVSAYGGGGYACGGAGTIYTSQSQYSGGQIVVDNGGQAGTNTTLTGAPTGAAITVKNGAVLVPMGSQTISTLLVASNGWVTPSSSPASPLTLTVTGNATIQAGGGIIADGKGYAGGSGTGAGRYYSTSYEYIGGGGGYGGYGASGGGTTLAYGGRTYGSVTAPVDLGSGGGGYNGSQGPPAAGGAGGGVIRLSVTGTLQVDGRISARGQGGTGPSAGGGSGGSLYLTVGTLTGAGSIDASGGAGNALGGGGGGGRIGITYSVSTFAGLMSAGGGGGYARGGAGTIYTKASNQNGLVVVDNGGQAGTETSWSGTGIVDVTVKGGAFLSLSGSQTIGNLLVASNGWVLAGTSPAVYSTLTLTVAGDATIQSGGGLIADGAGYPVGQGQGAGLYLSTSTGYVGGGGGNGGYGASSGGSPAARGGNTVGSLTVPSPGSGGGGYSTIFVGGAGGGPITLNVSGTLLVDGRISAAGRSGVSANAGGGSGGGIKLTVGTLAGSGIIAANGGAGNGFGGGGGGGRIAIFYTVNAFSGLVSAYGGGGYAWGGAGTIYTKANSQSWGQVLVDNGGRAGTNTSWLSSGTIDLTVAGAAVVSPPPGTQTFGNLLVASNGWLIVSNQVLTVMSNATIQVAGGIIADRTGNPAGAGPGAGKYVSTSSGYIGGGGGVGGYGAAGGAPDGYSAFGGNTYGSVTTPLDLGSGGGTYTTVAIGGAGGGAVRLNVSGRLQVDGVISAAGGPGIMPNAGGGSGGTVSLTAGTLAGLGVIAANGGDGNFLGGGGGGGRIALLYGAYNFVGEVSAYGGAGHAAGGAGTIYTKANSQSWGQVVADNGGQAGTNTSFGSSSIGTIDLTVRNGAVVAPPIAQVFGTLLVASNGWLTMPTPSSLAGNAALTVRGNATIQAGGGIIADGLGYAGGTGPGAGKSSATSYAFIGGGGGYGGYGASGGGTTSAYGGITYGSAAAPTDAGSGGGRGYTVGNSGTSLEGGAGGGAILLSVTGTLQVDGRISARGLAGAGPSTGGGAGGSIYLSAGALTGSGVISANGGAGNALGGGGGGGRISVACGAANTFSGLMSAYGGSGYATGGAGTIFISGSYSPAFGYQSVLLDNGGQTGTNTSWSELGSTSDLTVSGGAVVAPSSSQTIRNLVVASNGWIVITANQGSVPTLTVTGNATVQAGGGIMADGTGYSLLNGGTGPGGGSYSSTSGGTVSGGGGNGGSGATSGGSPAARGGNSMGSLTAPGVGSAGGTSSSTFVGGPGGGGIKLNVTGALEVDGRISAAGGAGVSANAGGGAGGGITLTVGTLAGSGVIAANGGAGNGMGGGGGGGRIAIVCTANAFSGLLSVYGGGGYAWGGAGTIYTQSGRQSRGQVLVDNGGQLGTNTAWNFPSSTLDLVAKGGAVVVPPAGQSFGNILVASNGWIIPGAAGTAPNDSMGLTLNVTSNATVQAGGGIIADGLGSASGMGRGAGKYSYSTASGYVGGGGGYGGYGATSGGTSPGLGGGTYGTVTAPKDAGSGGGGYPSTSPGGAGAGAIHISVSGSLLVNGRISANGSAGVGQGAGGGSGGGVWLSAGTLAGAGTISANGGAGNELGGGGGGGCISIQYGVNAFEGSLSAYGGGGYAWGGAGTIYTKANSQVMGQILVDNGGHAGTNTPLAYLAPFDLTVRGGAIASPFSAYLVPSSGYLILSNLTINSGGTLTCLKSPTNLDLAVLRNATIDAGGMVSVDGGGFANGSGFGRGRSTNSIGSGGGYGGIGGASSLLPGGGTYGSAQQPVDLGSSGGQGWGLWTGGGEGGGAIRFTVGGALTVNGRFSAGGNAALQDDGGGGSGGSIWLTAGALAGDGIIAADGGAGELYDGGGGGGGRIAIYTPLNVFSGVVSASGGAGLSPGQDGSIYSGSTPALAQVVSCTPTGVLNAAVSSLDVVFNTVVNPASVSAASLSLTAPGGVPVDGVSVGALSPYSFRFYFPEQTAQGDYAVNVGSPQLQDLYGQSLSQVYTSAFSIVWSSVQGTVTDTNGLPMPGVVLQPDGGIPSTMTDTNGSYVLSLPPGGTIVVTPFATNQVFVPGSRTYANLIGTLSNENYLAVSTIVPTFAMQLQTNACVLSWQGISGVTYQPLYSTNLVDWLPYADALPGTNGAMQVAMPIDEAPIKFFRLGASN